MSFSPSSPSDSPTLPTPSNPENRQINHALDERTTPSQWGQARRELEPQAPSKLVKQLRHRQVDRRRRERERRAFLQLAELIPLNRGEQPEQRTTHSHRLPIDKVTLLEAACAQLKVLRQIQSVLSSLSSPPPLVSLNPFPTQRTSFLPIITQPAQHPLLGLTTIRSMLWARHDLTNDMTGVVTGYLQTTSLASLVRPVESDMFSVKVQPASSDPQMSRVLEAAAALLRREGADAEVELGCPSEVSGQWLDMRGVIWIAVPPVFDSHRMQSARRAVSTTCMLMMHNCVFAFEQMHTDEEYLVPFLN